MGTPGELLYTANDERGGALRSVGLSTGAHAERFRSERDLIQSAAYDDRMDRVIAAMVSAKGRADRGIWEISLETASTRQIIEARPELGGHPPAGWQPRVFVTPDSKRVVSVDCVEMLCDARVFDAATGALESTSSGLRDEAIYGVTNEDMIGIVDCPDHPCRISAVDLHSGSLRPLVPPCVEAEAALASESGTAPELGVGAVADSACDPAAVLAVNVRTGDKRSAWVARSQTDRELLIIGRGPGLSYTAPPGWIALGPGGGFKAIAGEAAEPILLNLSTGEVIRLAD